MGCANSGSVGRGKRFGVVDRPARTDDNGTNVHWDSRFEPNHRAQPAANARPRSETVGYIPHIPRSASI